jgi:hypothetical protein
MTAANNKSLSKVTSTPPMNSSLTGPMTLAILINTQVQIYNPINIKINHHNSYQSATFLSVPPFQNILSPKTLNNNNQSVLLKSSPKADPNSTNSKNNPISNISTLYNLLKSQTL